MKSLSAFMYAELRMLPASLIADCSISEKSCDVLGRCSSSSRQSNGRVVRKDEQRAAGEVAHHVHEHRGDRLVVVRRRAEACPRARDTLIVGTLIMMAAPIICDSAVAACPAPMLATSRSASS